MRLDKFLKISRIIKRRPVAKKVIDNKKVKSNGKIAKSSYEVKLNDILEIEFYNKYIKIKIIKLPTRNISKEESEDLYEVLEVDRIEREIDEKKF